MQTGTLQVNKDLSQKIRRAAMNMLARREHSFFELMEKLKRKFPDEEAIFKQLEQLRTENLQSDLRFTEAYIRSRSERGYGRFRIEMELQQKKVPDHIVDEAMGHVDVDWAYLLEKQFLKKFDGRQPSDIQERAKYVRYFTYRGFSQKDLESII